MVGKDQRPIILFKMLLSQQLWCCDIDKRDSHSVILNITKSKGGLQNHNEENRSLVGF